LEIDEIRSGIVISLFDGCATESVGHRP